jgi:hypothetical protein
MNIHEFDGYPWIIRTTIKNSMDIHGSTMHRSAAILRNTN